MLSADADKGLVLRVSDERPSARTIASLFTLQHTHPCELAAAAASSPYQLGAMR